MATFKVTVQRLYVVQESAVVEIEAATPEEAIERAKTIVVNDGFDVWLEEGGSVDPDSYRWTVTDDNGVTLATSTGTYTNSNARGRPRNGL